MSRYIKKIIKLRKKKYKKKTTKMIIINEHDKIVEILNKNHIRFYNSKKKSIYTKRKTNVKSKYKNK